MAWRDVFTREAKRLGYTSRSIFKLKEINKRYRVFRKGDNVVDLGCYPGSWMQYAKQKVETGVVIGVDTKQIPQLKEEVIFVKKDVFVLEKKDIEKYVTHVEVVLSDLSPSTTGFRDIDQRASIELAEQAFEIAKGLRAKVFVCKYFQGPESDAFVQGLRTYFKIVKTYKPKSSRGKSIEMYAVCKK